MRLFGVFMKDRCSGVRAMASAYIDGRLSPEERARLEEHLAGCPRCQWEMKSIGATVALLHGMPEVAPQRGFAVAPARPLPGRWSLPALRYATVAVVVLLVAALAVDRAGLFERDGGLAGPGLGGSAKWAPAQEAYWTVGGVMNAIGSDEEMPVVLVVPDGTDDAFAAVEALSVNGVVHGSVEALPGGLARVVLKEGGAEALAGGGAEEFAVVSVPDGSTVTLAPNDGHLSVMVDRVVEGQEGAWLNIVSSSYTELYSFDMTDSTRVAAAATRGGDGWLRSLEYGLAGLAVLLGGVAAGVWLRRRRARTAEARAGRARR